MKVLLVTPPFYRILGIYNRYFPLGITQLGTVLKDKGYKVAVYDADFYSDPDTIDYSRISDRFPTYLRSFKEENKIWNEVIENIKKWKPDVVGISAYTTFAASAFHLAKLVKKNINGCKVIIGGPHATVRAEEILEICPEVDYVVRGEAEETMVELMNFIDKRKKELKNILGVSFRKGKKIVSNRDRLQPKNLDIYPMLNRSLLMNKNKLSSEDMGLIMTSRGCPYRCTYCASTKGIRYRSVDSVMEEIKSVFEKYETRQFTFKDDSFTVDRSRVVDLCNRLNNWKVKINWECNTRVNLVDEELLRLMKKAGCNFVKVGVETGSARVLKAMNKGISLDQVRLAAKLFRKVGLHWTGYFMMGVVGETEKDIKRTVDFMHEIKPNLGVIAVYEAFPGTVMFEEGIRKGLYRQNMTLNDFYSMAPDSYYKVDPKIQNEKITPRKFEIIKNRVNKEFHGQNKKIENVVAMARSKIRVYYRDPKIFFDDVKKMLSY
jgi:anaerobic magnesium-protoporphyrin IX monomethyl ester cyclase